MTTFQTVLLGIFGLLIVVGVLAFAGYGPTPSGTLPAAELALWGTLDQTLVQGYLDEWNKEYQDLGRVTYRQFDDLSFEGELVNALASGRGPDMLLLGSSHYLRQAERLLPISYENFSARDFLNTFVDGGTLFTGTKGISALPLAGDPLVMYWNKDLFASAGVARPPEYWDELATLPKTLTRKDANGNITQSTIALGGYRNISYAKQIVSSLFFQVGDPITEAVETETGFSGRVVLGEARENTVSGAESALRFFAEFGDPAKVSYSWNRGLANSRDLFLSGTLAIYLAPASEFRTLSAQNPHLNFDVALMPTIRPSASAPRNKTVAGELYGIAVLGASKSPAQAMEAAYLLTSTEWSKLFSERLALPSLRRDLALPNSADPYTTLFNQAVLVVRAWLDPAPRESDIVLRDMVESVLSGAAGARNALTTANATLQTFFK